MSDAKNRNRRWTFHIDTTPEPVAAPVAGFRALRLVKGAPGTGDLRFDAVNQGALFGIDATAQCMFGKTHTAPNYSCQCGFYSCATKNELEKSLYSMTAKDADSLCYATVETWGTVIIHEHGSRAQHQRITALHVPVCVCGRASVGFTAQVETLAPTCGTCTAHHYTFDEIATRLGIVVTADEPGRRRPADFTNRKAAPPSQDVKAVHKIVGAVTIVAVAASLWLLAATYLRPTYVTELVRNNDNNLIAQAQALSGVQYALVVSFVVSFLGSCAYLFHDLAPTIWLHWLTRTGAVVSAVAFAAGVYAGATATPPEPKPDIDAVAEMYINENWERAGGDITEIATVNLISPDGDHCTISIAEYDPATRIVQTTETC